MVRTRIEMVESGYSPSKLSTRTVVGAVGRDRGGYFGKENNLGIKSDPTDPGADGQATGAANSAKGCQRNL